MTLLELLVAMAIFSVIATAGYTALAQGVSIQGRLQEKRNFWRALDSGFNLIETDLSQAINRTPRISGLLKSVAFQGGRNEKSLAAGELLNFTRGGEISFRGSPVSPYRRIAYRLDDGQLYRSVRSRLDIPFGDPSTQTVILNQISSIELRYLIGKRWVDNWNMDIYGITSQDLPKAVEMIVTIENHGSYRRVFHVGHPY